MRLARCLLFAVLTLAAGTACKNDAGSAPSDLASVGPDLACEPEACTDEPGEDCAGCMHHIGECCYNGDPNMGTAVEYVDSLVQACSAVAGCARCCNECKALPCEELRKRNDCPYEGDGTEP